MSDFGELCPLFNTGVFSEVSFNVAITMTALSKTAVAYNLLGGSLSIADAAYVDPFSFGRTVVVTEAFLCQRGTVGVQHQLWLGHHTTHGAAPTVFGTTELSATISAMHTFKPFTNVDDKTFTSNEILGLGIATFTADATLLGTLGGFELIVRYKEK